MGVDDGGKYGACGETQAPACASFLFRPSLPSHWLQACRVSLGPPTCRPARRVDWRRSEASSRTETQNGPIGNRVGRAPPTQQTAQPHKPRSVCPCSGSSPAGRQLLTRRLRTHLGDHVRSILSVQSPHITKVAQPQRVAPLPWLASATVWGRLSQAYI